MWLELCEKNKFKHGFQFITLRRLWFGTRSFPGQDNRNKLVFTLLTNWESVGHNGFDHWFRGQ